MSLLFAPLPFDLPGCSAWVVDDVDLVGEHGRLVSEDDVRHAERFKSAERRVAAVAGSLGARLVVAEASGLTVAEVKLRRSTCSACGGPHGMPRVEPDVANISISHSCGLTCIALSVMNQLGVDIAPVSPELFELPPYGWTGRLLDSCADLEDVASRWAMVEATSKASGGGLARDPVSTSWSGLPEKLARVFPGRAQTVLHERDGRMFAISMARRDAHP